MSVGITKYGILEAPNPDELAKSLVGSLSGDPVHCSMTIHPSCGSVWDRTTKIGVAPVISELSSFVRSGATWVRFGGWLVLGDEGVTFQAECKLGQNKGIVEVMSTIVEEDNIVPEPGTNDTPEMVPATA